MSRKPRIAVTASRTGGRIMWLMNWLALRCAGAVPVRIRARPDGTHTLPDIGRFDAVLIGGGDDIGVELYDGEITPDIRSDPARDALEMDIIHEAVRAGMPILGVCRGAQMLNVAFGGTLHQEISVAYPGLEHRRMIIPKQQVDMQPGSMLGRVLGRRRLSVNALHHQAMYRLGDGLKSVGESGGGLVQAIEARLSGPFMAGVQWHPEFMFLRRDQRRLFAWFVRQARRYKQIKENAPA